MFEPLLLYLALLANDEPNADGMSSQRWLIERDFVLHIAYTQGIRTWTYPKNCITPTEALHYLVELTRDFLDPAQFDLLPFETLLKQRQLTQAFHDDYLALVTPEMYRAWVEAAVTEQRENRFGTPAWSNLVEMAKPTVPADALAKVRRRFGMLDRGPALIRAKPKFTKPRRVPTKITP
jgi:hypothetical protein